MQKIKEECGVFGAFASKSSKLAPLAYNALCALQHRGQESCGIAICAEGHFTYYKNTGLVNEVFDAQILDRLGQGEICIGHVRYCTTGENNRTNAQPIVINHIKEPLAIAHNGNLVNSLELRRALELQGYIFHTSSDTEVIAYLIAKHRLHSISLEEAILAATPSLQGAYSLVIMTPSKLIALRDGFGFRPLCFGKTTQGVDIVASESCALDALGASLTRDIEPGEMVSFSSEGVHSMRIAQEVPRKICSFEYIYFARGDSMLEGRSVHVARLRAGEYLAKTYPVDADVVVGVPDSGLDAALGYSKASSIPYTLGFIKNRYVMRTFIAPEQERAEKLRLKLNPIIPNIQGKRIVLVDDSIVRGNTTRRIAQLLRHVGVKEIHMRISSPPFLNPCFYGTDIDSQEHLIAHQHNLEEITQLLGLDSLAYLPLEGIEFMLEGLGCCTACFSGKYPTSTPQEQIRLRAPTHI
ncbi:amidophosphoribosyltransferase [Helicobacter baculiformis]|uniref:Amidophosphoribosyltransferase n=1 Tax=Helicobacter baculiformis TaxID=427351 RepID=A0ABV7ZGJ2_9HELI|nr:amidophosphoribosyltransferase [Helicobacter baculiformis]